MENTEIIEILEAAKVHLPKYFGMCQMVEKAIEDSTIHPLNRAHCKELVMCELRKDYTGARDIKCHWYTIGDKDSRRDHFNRTIDRLKFQTQ